MISTVLLALGFFSSVGMASEENLNPLAQVLRGRTCDVYRDRQGVSHVRPTPLSEPIKSIEKSPEKFQGKWMGFACLGWIHGKERAFELDYLKRTANGTRAEVLGRDSIQSDFLMRLIGLNEKASLLFHSLDDPTQRNLWAYAWGVNQGVQSALKSGVYEFNELGYQPDSWRPQDSLALILLQSFDQTRRSFQVQLYEWKRMSNPGSHQAPKLAPLSQGESFPWDVSILKTGEYLSARKDSLSSSLDDFRSTDQGFSSQELDQLIAQISAPWASPGMGSNNWVIDAQKSHTGTAWMANDPHLNLTRPAFWHWVHLSFADVDVIGATLPGVPVFASATNQHLSWGLTNSFLPAASVSLVPKKDLGDSIWTRPWIWVRLGKFKLPFFFKSFQRTRSNLPVLPLEAPEGMAFVLRWTGFDLVSQDLASFMDVIHAKDVDQADKVFAKILVPSWNFVFADDQGQIGYRAIGRTPRYTKLPALGVPMASLSQVEGSSEFNHPLEPEEMPHVMNPSRGYVVTANNQQSPADSLFSLGAAQVQSFRAFRIEELLGQSSRHDLASHTRIQCDLQAVDARFLLPGLLRILELPSIQAKLNENDRIGIQVLKPWDYQTRLDCRACAIFRRWVERLYANQDLNSSRLYRILERDPKSSLEGSFIAAVLESFHGALQDVMQAGEFPTWGAVHKAYFHHLAGGSRFEVEPISTPGDENTVNPGSADWIDRRFDHSSGASQRLVVEMSKPPKVYLALAGSNQDHQSKPDLSEADSAWNRWLNCELQKQEFPLDWSKLKEKVQIIGL